MDIVPNLKPIIYESQEMVFNVGDHIEEIFFLSFGSIDYTDSNGRVLMTFDDGEVFGHEEILDSRERTRVAIANTETLTFILDLETYTKVMLKYPDLNKLMNGEYKLKEATEMISDE